MSSKDNDTAIPEEEQQQQPRSIEEEGEEEEGEEREYNNGAVEENTKPIVSVFYPRNRGGSKDSFYSGGRGRYKRQRQYNYNNYENYGGYYENPYKRGYVRQNSDTQIVSQRNFRGYGDRYNKRPRYTEPYYGKEETEESKLFITKIKT